MMMLAVVAAGQIAFGPKGSLVVLAMPGWSQAMFALLLLAGSVATLASAMLTGCRGAGLEVCGLSACTVTLLVYALTIIDVTAHWITNPALAFGGTALGCAFRVGLVIRAART